MPVIPTFETQGSPQIGGRVAEIDPSAAGAPAGALAQGFARISDIGAQFDARYVDARRQAAAADAVAGASRALGDLQFKWSKIPDRAAAASGFDGEAAALRQTTLEGIADPLVKAHVQGRLDQEAVIRGLDTQNAAFQLESNARRGDLVTRLDQYAQSSATAGNDLLRAKLTDDAVADIKSSVAAGWVHPEEGAHLELKWKSDAERAAVERDMLADPSGTAAKILDPASYPGLNPDVRASLALRADNRALRIEQRAARDEAHRDAVAERDLRRSQGANAADLIAKVTTDPNANLDAGALADLVRTQRLSESGFNAILAAQRRETREQDDPFVAMDLTRRIDTPGEDRAALYDRISDAAAAHQLKTTTALAMTRALGEREKTGTTAIERAAYGELKTALGGQAVEQGLVHMGNKDQVDQVTRWVEAQGEWTRRVVAAHEDPQQVKTDMLARYAALPQRPAAWPRPRLGAVSSLEDVADIWQRTKAAADAGEISPAQLQDESQLLQRYKRFYETQPPPATPAKPGSGATAKPRGVKPEGQ